MKLSREERSEINRRNAQKSTGPKTKEGKQRSCLSALRHGLTGQIVVMPGEDLAAYTAYLKRFYDAHKPQGPDEQHCVQVMADSSWKSNRAKAWTDHMVAQQAELENPATEMCAGNDPQVNAALAIAAVVARITKDLSNMSMYEQRQWKMYGSAYDRLQKMQETRRRREQDELEEAALLLELHEAAELAKQQQQDKLAAAQALDETEMPPYIPVPYDPQADGFVFQVAEIKLHIRRKQRAAQARDYRYGEPEEAKTALREFPKAA